MDLIKDNFYTTSPLVSQITLSNQGKPYLTFHPDGRVTADPDMKPDEAAQKVIDFVISKWPAAIGKPQ